MANTLDQTPHQPSSLVVSFGDANAIKGDITININTTASSEKTEQTAVKNEPPDIDDFVKSQIASFQSHVLKNEPDQIKAALMEIGAYAKTFKSDDRLQYYLRSSISL